MKYNRATDHRALVLEAVATSPAGAPRAEIFRECIGPDFTRHQVCVMLCHLRREGLVGATGDGGHFITREGLDQLVNGHFDRAVPEFAPRPNGRKPRKHQKV